MLNKNLGGEQFDWSFLQVMIVELLRFIHIKANLC
jgi:hypothetical protein